MGRKSIWTFDGLIEQVKAVCEVTEDGCWLWRFGVWAERGLIDEQRMYPRLMIGGERKTVGRWVLIASGHPEVPGMEPCHSCDRPPCIAPDHLHWGTHKENMQEMGQRGRSNAQRYPENVRRGDDHWSRQRPELIPRGPRPGNYASGDEHWTRRSTEPLPWSGTNHYRARLNPDLVRQIRARSAEGHWPDAIAREFGVGRTTVRAILEGRTWKHVA